MTAVVSGYVAIQTDYFQLLLLLFFYLFSLKGCIVHFFEVKFETRLRRSWLRRGCCREFMFVIVY
jgi:hypothetical protein